MGQSIDWVVVKDQKGEFVCTLIGASTSRGVDAPLDSLVEDLAYWACYLVLQCWSYFGLLICYLCMRPLKQNIKKDTIITKV